MSIRDVNGIEPIGDRIGSKERRNRHGNQAGFPACDVGDGRPRILPKQQHDSVALGEAIRNEEICQLISLPLDVAKSHLQSFTVGRLANQGNFARIGRVAVANVDGDVVARRNFPTK